MLLAALCAASCAPARAADVPAADAGSVEYRIEPGALADALTAFARQSRLQILFDAQLVAGRRSAGVDARVPAAQALESLLAGSGLSAEQVNANTFVLKAAPVSAPSARARRATASRAPERPGATPTELMPVHVTGSHIRRSEWETASPVTVITREQIERSGLRSIADLLRTQPGIEVAARPEVMASQPAANYAYGGAAGASTVGMRGLGARATLVLVDGRRVAGYGLTQSGAGQVVDLNGIPLGLVERVEILRDGASAIYGADAIGGVINIILRRSFDGEQVTFDYGVSGRGDAHRRGGSATLGGEAGGARVFLHADWSSRDPLTGAQRDWYTLDRRSRGLPDRRSLYSFPGNYAYLDERGQIRYAPLPGCPQHLRNDAGLCVLDEAKYTTIQTEQDTRSVFARASRPIGESTELHADVRLSRIDQKQQAAPFAATVLLPAGVAASPDPTRPVIVFYSFADVGPVRESTVSTTHALNVGAKGTRGTWQWNADVSSQGNSVMDRIDGFLKPSEALRLLTEDRYQFGGPNPAEVIAALSPRLTRKGRTTLIDAVASASGPAWEMPAGTAMLGVGAEARYVRVKDVPDPLLQSDDRLFGERSFVQRASSNASAAYVELELPLTARLTSELAWRFDRSQSVGSAVSPKVGLRWRLSDALLLRGTAAEGYRPPTLLEINQPTVFNGTEDIVIPATLGPCGDPKAVAAASITCRLQKVSRSNPNGLRAETSHSHTLGFVYAPTDAFSLSVDLYRIGREQEIGALPVSYALQHPEQFPGFLRRDKLGNLVGINTFLVNLGRTETRGVDLATQYRFGAGTRSTWAARFDATYSDRRDANPQRDAAAVRYIGYDSNPRVRARLGLDWTLAPWTATANVTYIGSYRNTSFAGDELGCTDAQVENGRCVTPGFASLDLGASYSRSQHWSASLNVSNVFDRKPVYYGSFSANYNILFDDPVGRYYSLTLKYRF